MSIHHDCYNSLVQPLLTDFYQITMCYAYWKNRRGDDSACFDLFFRKSPFGGEFTVFAGVEECLKYLRTLKFSTDDIDYLRKVLPNTVEEAFYEYLAQLDASNVILYAIQEGTVVFPKVPLLRVEGPLAVVQLVETTLLTLVNYASLVATNAARFRMAAGPKATLLEFGLRRAQGPDGGLSASRYCYMGGFDGTSNVLAGKMFNIPIKGTHAHAYVSAYHSADDLKLRHIAYKDNPDKEPLDLVDFCTKKLVELRKVLAKYSLDPNEGELCAFISYALSFPTNFLALVDTYDVCKSGVPNFCLVALALAELGYKPIGIRLDSGDLSYLSKETRAIFGEVGAWSGIEWFEKLNITASNDINEDTLYSLKQQGHSIDAFGIGTHLVTCQKQPALGCVYKLVDVGNRARIKLSEDIQKVTIPGKKKVYRLYGSDGHALVDIMTRDEEPPPQVGQRILCRHPFFEAKRAYVQPSRVEDLLVCYWDKGKQCRDCPSLHVLRDRVGECLQGLREDHKRPLNPTPYKVSISNELYQYMHELWMKSAPIGELS